LTQREREEQQRKGLMTKAVKAMTQVKSSLTVETLSQLLCPITEWFVCSLTEWFLFLQGILRADDAVAAINAGEEEEEVW
jgi:hypothetical protein